MTDKPKYHCLHCESLIEPGDTIYLDTSASLGLSSLFIQYSDYRPKIIKVRFGSINDPTFCGDCGLRLDKLSQSKSDDALKMAGRIFRNADKFKEVDNG